MPLLDGMGSQTFVTVDGNEAAASIAYRVNEIIAIYPITPSSTMGELADEWSAAGRRNIWGTVPHVVEMQSEAGAIGAVHGALQGGSLATTFTASQGLLLMIPNLYKIAGELTSFAMHVAARTVATHALSIFGDHSDVMAVRQTGVALLSSGSVQEAHDFALIAQAATLRARVPFIHFFDGFRTSHEVARIARLDDDELRAMLDPELVAAHRTRALTPDHPVLRGSAQNPDVFFQGREAGNRFYLATPSIVHGVMDRFADLTGRRYHLFEYAGHPQAERVIVMMGSGAGTAAETVEYLQARGERVGLVTVRLYRPFDVDGLLRALPPTVRSIAVLDRTKEPGAIGEPLYLDVVGALHECAAATCRFAAPPIVVGGRYGLSSKEFTPAMVKAVFDNLDLPVPRNHFTVGIVDDVTHTSLPVDPTVDIEAADVVRCVFYGLGADGTVGANKNSIKIIGDETDFWPQGYFVYDSKKSGALTVSHLRFGPRPIRSAHLISRATFIACHQPGFLDKYDVLETADDGATFLLNTPFGPDDVWAHLPADVQRTIVAKRLRLFVIDAYGVAGQAGMGSRINTVMQVCFFALSNVLPQAQAIEKIREAIGKTYAKRGAEVVKRNCAAVDAALAHLHAVRVPTELDTPAITSPSLPATAPPFVTRVTAVMLANHGDQLPVSAFPVDGTWPTGTARWEKRNLAQDMPVWEPELCIQCNKCAEICPHAAIRAKVYPAEYLAHAPETFKHTLWKGPDFKGQRYSLQVAPEDCTGCDLCVQMCPAHEKGRAEHRALAMAPQQPRRDAERRNWEYFLSLPEADRATVKRDVKGAQLLQPLFEFSGACAGCGETPYIKLLTQLFGDRLLIANATGCSSIFGGNLPTTPYTVNGCGRGPAWANSLFEDNAEFGLGFRLALDSQERQVRLLLERIGARLDATLVTELLAADQSTEAGIALQRERVARLRAALASVDGSDARTLADAADALIHKSVWIIGGDGWAYDIGFGGLDHVLALGRKVNVLVLDTEVYSNTGGQQSKATPLGATAKFAALGKAQSKKDLGLMAMTYGNVYVARIALGAKDAHTLKVLLEAEAFPGPALVIAYAHCIAHGYDLAEAIEHQKAAVDTGYWPLYRYDPRRAAEGLPPLQLDSGPPKSDIGIYMQSEGRFQAIQQNAPERFAQLTDQARHDQIVRRALYERLSAVPPA